MHNSIKRRLKQFFTSNIKFTDTVSFRKIVMINSILIFLSIIFALFTILNFTILNNPIIGILDIMSLLLSVVTIIYLRKKKNVKQAALISTLILALFIIFFTIQNQNTHFGIIWVIFFPILAIIFNGKILGLFYSILFNILIFCLAYNGLGVWDYGHWNYQDLIRFTAATILMTYGMYMIESSNESADNEIQRIRADEQKILKTLQIQAITDDLTKMYNRRYFNTVAPSVLNTARRENKFITFFILDIDYFKKYNDYYGHQKGDEALKMMADALMKFIHRDNDLVFRLGGEEFAGLVISQKEDDVKKWLSTLNQKIENLNIEHLETMLKKKILTVSCGVYTLKATAHINVELLYKIADDALYKAKESGRNKTEFVSS